METDERAFNNMAAAIQEGGNSTSKITIQQLGPGIFI
jgi:hypothetical protein